MYTADTVIAEAEKWIGYLEKSKLGTDAQLQDKEWSPGSANITWFWTWLDRHGCLSGLQGNAWCDAFVDFCHAVVGGVEKARKSLNGFSAYTPDSAERFKRAGRWIEPDGEPERGDQIFFKNSVRIYHTGIVTRVTSDRIHTVDGNTSSEPGVVENGGCVRAKSYPRNYAKIAGYGRPLYDNTPSRKPYTDSVKRGQGFLNQAFQTAVLASCSALLDVDGKYGTKTRDACLAVWKYYANHQCGANLTLSNHNYGDSCREVAKKMQLRKGDTNVIVYVVQLILAAKGYYGGDMDAQYGDGMETAVKEFQRDCGLTADGIVGADTYGKLFE